MKPIYKLAILLCLMILPGQQVVAQYFSQRDLDRSAMLNLLAYLKAKRNGENLKKWWKGESTIGVSFSSPLTYTQRSKYDSVEFISQPSYDTTLKNTAKPQLSIHANGNSSHLLTRLGASSILSLSLGAQWDLMRWKYETWNGNTGKTSSESLVFAQLGVPVTLDYKWGCDVDFDPEIKSCFAFGAGFMPTLGMSFSGIESASTNFRLAPYAYVSFGFYARGCWKIRLSYMPGNYTVFNDSKTNYGGVINTLNIQGSNIFSIGITHMSHSNDWGKGSAWRGSGIFDGSGGGGRHHVHENSRMF